MHGVFLGLWEDKGLKGIMEDFEIKPEQVDGIKVLFAHYDIDNYNGEALVIFEKDGKLYEVNGGHCSCYGLEGQWNPDEVLMDELYARIKRKTECGDFSPKHAFILLALLDLVKNTSSIEHALLAYKLQGGCDHIQ